MWGVAKCIVVFIVGLDSLNMGSMKRLWMFITLHVHSSFATSIYTGSLILIGLIS